MWNSGEEESVKTLECCLAVRILPSECAHWSAVDVRYLTDTLSVSNVALAAVLRARIMYVTFSVFIYSFALF